MSLDSTSGLLCRKLSARTGRGVAWSQPSVTDLGSGTLDTIAVCSSTLPKLKLDGNHEGPRILIRPDGYIAHIGPKQFGEYAGRPTHVVQGALLESSHR
jgi:hypothetical protein